jgi:triosephosphate isomerase
MCFLFETEVVVGVPAIYLEYIKNLLPPNVSASAQNCYKVPKGAFTGMFLSTGLVIDVSVTKT